MGGGSVGGLPGKSDKSSYSCAPVCFCRYHLCAMSHVHIHLYCEAWRATRASRPCEASAWFEHLTVIQRSDGVVVQNS